MLRLLGTALHKKPTTTILEKLHLSTFGVWAFIAYAWRVYPVAPWWVAFKIQRLLGASKESAERVADGGRFSAKSPTQRSYLHTLPLAPRIYSIAGGILTLPLDKIPSRQPYEQD